MVTRMEYRGDSPTGRYRRVEIDWMDDTEWRVWQSDGIKTNTVWRRSLTSAQSTAREFIRTGTFSTKTGWRR